MGQEKPITFWKASKSQGGYTHYSFKLQDKAFVVLVFDVEMIGNNQFTLGKFTWMC